MATTARGQKPRNTARGAQARVSVDRKTRARAVKLATTPKPDGKRWTRNGIAKELGISTATVSRILQEDGPEGFSWLAQAQTAVAAGARVRDLKAERQQLSQDVLDEVRRVMGRLSAPHEVIHWDKDGMMHRGTIDSPTSGDVKNYAIAVGILLDKHLVLVRADTDDRDLSAVDSWLDAMTDAEAVPA